MRPRIDNINMNIFSVTTTSAYYKYVEALLITAFPENERRNVGLQRQYADHHPHFKVYAVCNDNQFIGFFTLWSLGAFQFVEHLAILPKYRNCGYGTQVLQQIKDLSSLPILLEIERGATSEQLARKHFYERSGFCALDIPYLQPPYEAGGEALEMHLMMCATKAENNSIVEAISIEKIIKIIYAEVYGIV